MRILRASGHPHELSIEKCASALDVTSKATLVDGEILDCLSF